MTANSFKWYSVINFVWLLRILKYQIAMPVHIHMLKLIKNWIAIDNLILLHNLLFNFALILPIIRRVNYILQLGVVSNLQSTYFLLVYSDVDTIDLLHQFFSHVLVAKTAFLLVAGNLDEL